MTILSRYIKRIIVLSACLLMCVPLLSAQDLHDDKGISGVGMDAAARKEMSGDRHDARMLMVSRHVSMLSPMAYDRLTGLTYRAPFVFATNFETVNASGVAPIAMWNDGMLYASGGRQSYPGMMGVESGSITLMHTSGPLTFTGSLMAEKTGYFRGLQTIYGVGGSVEWRMSDALSLTVFGSYYGNSRYLGPAMSPFLPTTNFGGYMSVHFNEHWGVDVGAQSVYNPATGRRELRPIGAPFYKLDNGVKLGVDVGGIVYELMRNASLRSNGGRNRGNNIIGPPIPMGPPPVR